LPPAFRRAGRFNAVFFVDRPDEETIRRIWKYYLTKFQVPKHHAVIPDDTDFTGAEIESCCNTAVALDIPLTEAVAYVTQTEKLDDAVWDALRTYANGRCLDAHTGGKYEYLSTRKED